MNDDSVSPPTAMPALADVLVIYAAALLYTFSLGSLFSGLSPFWGISLFTAGIGVLPLAYAFFRGIRLSAAFPLKRPSRDGLRGASLMTAGLVSLALAATGLLSFLMPSGIPGSGDAEAALSGMGDWAAVLAVGLLPALCEEVLFRGFILSGLRQVTGKWRAIALSALLFGILHRDPARIPLTAGVGLALGYAAWETRSIVLSAAMHGLYNLSLFFMARMAGAARDLAGSGGALDGSGALTGFPAAATQTFGSVVLQAVSALLPLAPFALFGVLSVRAGARRLKDKTPGPAVGPGHIPDGSTTPVFPE